MSEELKIEQTSTYGVPKPTIQEWVKSPDFVQNDFTKTVDNLSMGGLLGSSSFVLGLWTVANPSTGLFLFLGFLFSGLVAGCVQKRMKVLGVITFGFLMAITLNAMTPKTLPPVVDQVEIQSND